MSFPINLSLSGRLAVIAGGGEAARKKAIALSTAGARVCIVAPAISDEMRLLAETNHFELRERPYESTDIEGAFVVFAATDDDFVNEAVCTDARAARILVCDVSKPERGDFSTTATVQIGDITFAVDTGGAAPAFAKRLAGELREHFGESYAAAVKTLERMREYVKTEVSKEQRAPILRDLAGLPVEQLASMNVESVVCATRGSALAMIQARAVAAKLARRGIATTLLNVTTTGDRMREKSFAEIGSESLFVKELEAALRDGRARYAVHSCKDLPSSLPGDMCIAAISAREDPRDVFCSERYETFASLPPGARVGTSSVRRRAQLWALRSDLQYLDLRGNVDTRLRKLKSGEYEAIVLAAAGLRRLGAAATHTVPFETGEIIPAAGQGALAVEVLARDQKLAADVREAINDGPAEIAIACERAALRELRGGCQAPIGVHAYLDGGELLAAGVIASEIAIPAVRAQIRAAIADVDGAQALGIQLAKALKAQQPLAGKVAVLPRTQDRPSRIAAALHGEGADVVEIRSGEAEPSALGERVPDLIVFPSSGAVAAAASYLEGLHRLPTRPAIAAMGPESSAAAHAAGFTPDIVAREATIDSLLDAIRAQLSTEPQSL